MWTTRNGFTGAWTTSIQSGFFFQAEDGIRDYKVTGVQTCALPICFRIAPVHEEILCSAGNFCQGEKPCLDGAVRRTRHPRGKCFPRLPVRLIERQQFATNPWDGPCGDGNNLASKPHPIAIHSAATQKLVIRRLPFADFPDIAVKSDVCDVMKV